MKRIRHFLLATGIGVLVFAGEFGCVLDSEPFTLAEASQDSKEIQGSQQDGFLKPVARNLKVAKKSPDVKKIKFPQTNQTGNNPEEPNGIELETCEPDPDEVAVPLNVEEDKQCHKVHAQAIFADSNGVSKVAAKYTWSLTDDSAVSIVGYPVTKNDSSIKLEAKYDIFSEPNLTQEPGTLLTVCVEPESGWQTGAQEVCRSLPVYTVANMQGAWCFTGDEFTPDQGANCHSLAIEQDGRYLTIETYDHGTVYEKQLDFYYNNLEYRTVESSYTEIRGIVLAGEDVEGEFSAFRLPL